MKITLDIPEEHKEEAIDSFKTVYNLDFQEAQLTEPAFAKSMIVKYVKDTMSRARILKARQVNTVNEALIAEEVNQIAIL
jgi:hypothetical protein